MAQAKNSVLKDSFDKAWGAIQQDYETERDNALRALEESRTGRVSQAALDIVRYVESGEILDMDHRSAIFWELVMLHARLSSPAFSAEERTCISTAVLQNKRLIPILHGYSANTGFFADVWLHYLSSMPDKERSRSIAREMLRDQETLLSLGRHSGHTITKVALGLIKALPETEQDTARLKILDNTELLTGMKFFQRNLIIDGLLHTLSDRDDSSYQAFRLLAERQDVLRALYGAESEYVFHQVTVNNYRPCSVEFALVNRLSQKHAIKLIESHTASDENSVPEKHFNDPGAQELLACTAESETGAEDFHQRREKEFQERKRLQELSRRESHSGSARLVFRAYG